MKKLLFSLAMVSVLLGFQSCKNDDDNPQPDTQVQEAKENYANIVLAGYQDSHTKAVELKNAIDAFVSNPTQAGFDVAKQTWYDAREPYGQTEAFRFANGPIDSGENQVEGLLNAWPLDESFVDYVGYYDGEEGDVSLNIINNIEQFPEITKELLRSLNEYNGNERSISVGYHGIEFLLWGQDTQEPTPGNEHTTGGQRPYTDYVNGGTAENQDRRRQYLKFAAEILVEDLTYLVNEWSTDGGNYRSTFLAMDNDEALRNILTGIGVLAGSELANERIYVAVSNVSQEDEHSCFSDNTHRDIRTNFYGIRNVYQGKYTRIDGSVVEGKSIEDLLTTENQAKASEINTLFATIDDNIEQTTIPFDYSLTQAADVVKWNEVVSGLRTLGNDFAQAANILGVGTFQIPE